MLVFVLVGVVEGKEVIRNLNSRCGTRLVERFRDRRSCHGKVRRDTRQEGTRSKDQIQDSCRAELVRSGKRIVRVSAP